MKKLTKFFIKSFVGPFLATFLVSMFMLIMQFLWKYIDDLMGKGLEVNVIIELLFYVSASLLPLALPLAILLSSLIILGNLGENLELTALKSSGLSLYRILRPLTGIIILIAIGTFYFANYVIPIANYKWHSIIWDIQEKKMSAFLKPGVYTQEIDGFSIKIKEEKNNTFKNIVIHDRRESNEIKTIIADSGEYLQSENGEFLFFKLYNGSVFEELAYTPNYHHSNSKSKSAKHIYPSRKSNFKTATYKMDMSGFKLQRTKDDLFKDDYEMLNVFQISRVADSIQEAYKELEKSLIHNAKMKHAYFQGVNIIKKQDDRTNNSNFTPKAIKENAKLDVNIKEEPAIFENKHSDTSKAIRPVYHFSQMSGEIRSQTIDHLRTQLRTNLQNIEGQILLIDSRKRNMNKFAIEFHRKFALSFSIIVLFFIGAPLGAIVKRGGFGTPVVIAAVLFMFYYVLITIGDEMAKNETLMPFLGMWGPNIILIPIAFLLMLSASHDGSFRFLNQLFKKNKKNV